MSDAELNLSELNLFSYEILGLVGRQGASAHDLLRMARRGRMLDWAGESRYYVEPKRLAKLGYLDSRREPGKTRERTVYSLTDKGLEALRDYAATPVRFQPFKSDLLLRLLLADLVGEAPVRESAGALREELAELLAQVEDAEASAETLPHRRKYLRLVCLFLRDLLDLHLVGEAPVRESAGALREELAELLRQVEEAEASAESLPHRRKYLRLVCLFLRDLLDLHLDWIDDIERRLSAEPATASAPE